MFTTKYFILIIAEDGKVSYIEKGEYSYYNAATNFALGVSRPALFNTVEEIRELLATHPEFNKHSVMSDGSIYPPSIYHSGLGMCNQRRSSKGRVQICAMSVQVVDEFETQKYSIQIAGEKGSPQGGAESSEDYGQLWMDAIKKQYITDVVTFSVVRDFLRVDGIWSDTELMYALRTTLGMIAGDGAHLDEHSVTALRKATPVFALTIYPFVQSESEHPKGMSYLGVPINKASVSKLLEILINAQ